LSAPESPPMNYWAALPQAIRSFLGVALVSNQLSLDISCIKKSYPIIAG
jgi:hypothetical protein